MLLLICWVLVVVGHGYAPTRPGHLALVCTNCPNPPMFARTLLVVDFVLISSVLHFDFYDHAGRTRQFEKKTTQPQEESLAIEEEASVEDMAPPVMTITDFGRLMSQGMSFTQLLLAMFFFASTILLYFLLLLICWVVVVVGHGYAPTRPVKPS